MTRSSVRIKFCIAVQAFGLAFTAVHADPQDPGFSYQGQVKFGGSPVTGMADFQFTLFDDLLAGNQIGTQSVMNVALERGLFTVTLNAAGEMGAAAFNGDARWVEIAVRSPAGSGTYTTLTPRQPLTASPYASYAVEAFNGGDQTGNSALRGVLWTRSSNATDVFVGGQASAGIGPSSPASRLHVRAHFNAVDTARFDDNLSTSQLRIATPQSAGRAELQAWNLQTNVAGPLALNVAGGNVGIGTSAPGSRLDVAGTFEADAFRLNGNGAAAGRVLTSDASGNGTWQAALSQWTTNGTHIGYTGAGNVGIGTTSPNISLDVRNNGMIGTSATSMNQHDVSNRGTKASFGYQPVGTAEFVGMRSVIAAGTSTCGNTADIRFDTWECATSISREVMRITGGGEVGIGTATPASKLDVFGTITSDGLDVAGTAIADDLTVSSIDFDAALIESTNPAGTWLNLRNASANGRYWQFISTGSGNGQGAGKLLIGNGTSATSHTVSAMTIETDGDIGIGTATPAAKLDVIGTARVSVLQITGGADVAEPFNINSGCRMHNAEIAPGIVVTIDPNRVGELRVSGKAYDKTVAGIISGANGVNPGMVLTQEGSVADGKHPVALTGRVWAWCDADAGGAIVAGDMLTTSNTPGHAMRVSDHDQAHGAVIGKAMSSLKNGKGLVLVLVNLQ